MTSSLARRHRRRLTVVWAAGVAILAADAAAVATGPYTHGIAAYYTAARLLVEGRLGPSIYDDARFGYAVQEMTGTRVRDVFGPNPPSMALLLAPLGAAGPGAARWLWLAAGVAAWGWATAALMGHARRRAVTLPPWLLAGAMLAPPVWATLRTGQAYLVVAALTTAAALDLGRGRDRRAGTWLAAGLVTKTSGLPILLLAGARGRWRPAVTAIAASVAVAAVAATSTGIDVWLRYPAYVAAFVRDPKAAAPAYQTTAALMKRICVADPTWNPAALADCGALAWVLPVVLIGGALALSLRAAVSAESADTWVATALCLSVLVLPVAEDHQFVLLAPAMLLLFTARGAAPAHRCQAWAWSVGLVLWLVPLSWTGRGDGWWMLLGSPRLYAAWWFWGMTCVTAGRGGRARVVRRES